EDLVARGEAVWNVEYRRVGQAGGGWPGTFDDAAAAIDQLATIAQSAPLDLARVAVVGHSAGGQLALWAAGRASIRAGSPGAAPAVVPVLAIGQGPVGDLIASDRDQLGGGAVTELLGGTPSDQPERYAVATPSTATTARLVVVRGGDDTAVPAEYTLPPDHDAITVLDVPDEDHFDLIDPASVAWAQVVAELTTI
ncbi:MAG: alpha/beta hydrolase, partial [Ilumatobacteraceae bacterium]